ncbi:MAG: helix-turn-helix domain-containing protein, partial [Deferribacterales bacterium]
NERDLIVKALRKTGGNKSKAAEILEISRRTLHNKIKEFDIEDE